MLEKAARRLIYSHISITDISMDSGYECPGDFSRAFKKHFGLSPSVYRKSGGQRIQDINEKFNIEELAKNGKIVVSIKKIHPFYVASLRHTGPYENSIRTWYKLKGILTQENIVLTDKHAYGVSHDIPHITEPENFRMDVCFSVAQKCMSHKDRHNFQRCYGITFRNLGEHNLYISALINGPHQLLFPAFNYIHNEWIINRRLSIINANGFEIYHNNPHHTIQSELRTEIFIPVIRK